MTTKAQYQAAWDEMPDEKEHAYQSEGFWHYEHREAIKSALLAQIEAQPTRKNCGEECECDHWYKHAVYDNNAPQKGTGDFTWKDRAERLEKENSVLKKHIEAPADDEVREAIEIAHNAVHEAHRLTGFQVTAIETLIRAATSKPCGCDDLKEFVTKKYKAANAKAFGEGAEYWQGENNAYAEIIMKIEDHAKSKQKENG